MPVDTQHPEYEKAAEQMWPTMRDSVGGEDDIKEKTTTYLPHPNGSDTTDTARYNKYILRARYVRYTGRTTDGLNGAIFRKSPTVELPSTLEYMKEDADGAGQNLEQFAKELTQEVLDVGRAGLMLDRPQAIEGATKEDDQKNKLRSNLSIYKTESIINWKTIRYGGATILTKVVLSENIEIEGGDGFESETEVQYRVLGLDASWNYYQQIYKEIDSGKGGKEFIPEDPVYPTNKNGSKWGHIPFVFVGSKDNTPSVDKAPFYGMAKVNIGHYINSADYEEGVHMFGQPTPWCDPGNISSEQWKAANPNGVVVGSRDGVIVGEGGKLELLFMPSNTAAKEAMDQKESQMISIGAKIIQDAGKNQTATEAMINASAENSVLNNIVGNSEDAIEWQLRNATEYEGGDLKEVEFKINREFFPDTITAQDVMAYIALAERSDLAPSDITNRLRRTGWIQADRTDEDIKEEIENSGGGL